jgi:DNA-binding MarR family transcriptional regulator
MNLDRSFGYLVNDVARLFARRFDQRALVFLGLTRSQCRILGHLARHEGINQAGLADLLEIKPMTLVRQVDRMAEDGWVERRLDPADRRARRLMLTEKARPVLAQILDLSGEVRHEAFADLSEEDGRRLLDLLRRVHANLAEPAPLPPLGSPPGVRAAAARRARRESPDRESPGRESPDREAPGREAPDHAGWSALGDGR